MPKSPATTADRLYTKLKQDVITCVLAPGSPFSEGELCRRYRTSRTPVREACRRLEREGLVTIIPFRGYFIAPLTFAEFQNLQEAQLITEPSSASLAAQRATPAQLKAIEAAAKYEYRVGQRNSYYTFLQRNFDLHVGIAEASQNEHLVEIATALQTRLMRFFYLIIAMDAFGPDLVEEHEKIVSAIRGRNPEMARQRAAEHVRKTIERSARIFVQSTRSRLGGEHAGDASLMNFDIEIEGAFRSGSPARKNRAAKKHTDADLATDSMDRLNWNSAAWNKRAH
jgi:DNA-binding GntR family transcriptional regulator